jgi:UV DNA damage repair endonuclease
MQEIDRLMIKKHELEQLIKYNQEYYLESSQFSGQLSNYASHPADMASHLQVLYIELEKINGELAQYNQEQMVQDELFSPELH